MYMPQVTLPALSISLLAFSGTFLSPALTLHLRHFTLSSAYYSRYTPLLTLSTPLLTLSYTLLPLRPNTLAPLYSIICLCRLGSSLAPPWPCLRTRFVSPLLYGRYGCISMPALWPDSASPSRVDISPKSIFSIRMTLPRRVMSAARRIFTSYAVWLSFSSKLST